MKVPPIELLTHLDDDGRIDAALLLKCLQFSGRNLIKFSNCFKRVVLEHIFEQQSGVEPNVPDLTYQLRVLFSKCFEFQHL